jgi:putative protease
MCFVTGKGELKGFRVDRVEDGRVYPNTMEDLSKGAVLFRNRDHGFMKILEGKTAERRIGVRMVFRQDETEIALTVTDEDGFTASSRLDFAFQEARQPDKIAAQIRNQLTSTGNTIFTVTDLGLETEKPGFLPLSTLNSLRRDALDRLLSERKKGYVINKRREPAVPPPEYPEKNLDYRANVFNRNARTFYEKHGVTVIEDALEAGGSTSGKTLMTTRYCIRREIGACLKETGGRDLVPPLTLTDGKRTYTLRFDCKACRMHVESR